MEEQITELKHHLANLQMSLRSVILFSSRKAKYCLRNPNMNSDWTERAQRWQRDCSGHGSKHKPPAAPPPQPHLQDRYVGVKHGTSPLDVNANTVIALSGFQRGFFLVNSRDLGQKCSFQAKQNREWLNKLLKIANKLINKTKEEGAGTSGSLYPQQELHGLLAHKTHATGPGSSKADVSPWFINYTSRSLYLIRFYEREAQLDE